MSACTYQLRTFSVLPTSLTLNASLDFRTFSLNHHRQWFSTTGGSDGGGDHGDGITTNNNNDNNTSKISNGDEGDDSTVGSNAVEASEGLETDGRSELPTAATTTTTTTIIDDENYTPAGVMSTFEDTSYYHPIELPSELSARYSHMSNEELQDSSTIPGWDLLIHSPPTRGTLPKGALVGKVVSTKMMKTINVAVDRYRTHKKYKKRLRYTRKFMAHDEREVAKDGDTVLIVPCQRISKHKHFMLNQIITPKGQL